MTIPTIYMPRTYRDIRDTARFKTFRVVVETSDLYVRAAKMLEKETERLIQEGRAQVKWAISRRPEFLKSLEPIDLDPSDSALAAKMIKAGKKVGTGPMAAVAGAIAEFVGYGLLPLSPEVIIENGGDIFMKISEPVIIGLFAGNSPFSMKLGINVEATPIPLGVCTSSATVGPSLSFGRADAATVISYDVALADAAATALGNRIHSSKDLKPAVEWCMSIPEVRGALAVLGNKISVMGEVELVPITQQLV